MKVSYNWLKDYIDFPYSPEELQDILTMLGLEVGKMEIVGGAPNNLEGVFVGEVITCEQHPNADRLKVCTVDVGQEEHLHIVCGAPNVAQGQKVPVATVGTTLLPFGSEKSFKIKKGKIRGELSMGMICAEDELGLGPDHDGIMVLDPATKVGVPAIDAIPSDRDYVLEIDLTPNRIDGASHYGVARDLAAYMRTKAKLPKPGLDVSKLTKPNPVPVTIKDEEKCRRYTSIYIEGVTVGQSPEWMQKRLKAIGLRPINNIVDITNYVLHELGQPMHAFDADQLAGGEIIVRTLDKNEKFVTLDEEERELIAGTDLLICDAQKPVCIAGTMGGLHSGVTADTKKIFLEVAYFDAGSVRRTSKRLGINSDSSFRYERGADPHMTVPTAIRAASLIVEIAGGTPSVLTDQKIGEFPHFDVDLSIAKTHKLIGKEIGRETIIEILEALEVIVIPDENPDLLHLKVPPYRVDVQRDVDVIEDILRVYGYNDVEIPQKLNASLTFRQYQDVFRLRESYSNHLSANGFYEIVNNSLVHQKFGNDKAVPIVNPLSEDLGIMRQSMIPGVLEAVKYNQNRQQENLALYEFGKTYKLSGADYEEQEWLAIAVSGQKHPVHWASKASMVSLATLTRESERLQRWIGFEGQTREAEHPGFDYCLEMIHNGKSILHYGKIKSGINKHFGIRNEVFCMLIDWARIVEIYFSSAPEYEEIPVYPAIRRDISMLIHKGTSFSDIHQIISKTNPKLIRSVDLHDVYQGKGIDDDKKSYLVSIELRDNKKTLEDNIADKVIQRIYASLEKELGAEIRR